MSGILRVAQHEFLKPHLRIEQTISAKFHLLYIESCHMVTVSFMKLLIHLHGAQILFRLVAG
jgi:hypothetical protein